jgi:hypothetical protein
MHKILLLVFLPIFALQISCAGGEKSDSNNGQEICDNNIDDDGDSAADCQDSDCWGHSNCLNNNNIEDRVILKGTIWAPGGDDPNVMEANKVPVPQALIAAYPHIPQALPEGMYCNKCVEVPIGISHTFSGIDGSFELALAKGMEYWILVQKGEFRRVTHILPQETQDMEGGEWEIPSDSSGIRNSMLTLPNKHLPSGGSWIPKILVIRGSYEDMKPLWTALGFEYGIQIDEVDDFNADTIAASMDKLRQYNLIVTTCGDNSPFLIEPNIRKNLRQYVREGGKLYVDDFSYDWAEQPFPEFLTFANSNGNCSSGPTPNGTVGSCNNWTPYNPSGIPNDPYFETWLDIVHSGGNIPLEGAWDIISGMNAAVQGECSSDDVNPNCKNGLYVALPKVWMYGNWPGYSYYPITVSWNHYCGKVLYTTYHTHSGSSEGGYNYALLIQEKIMLYLIMEISTCTKPIVVQ